MMLKQTLAQLNSLVEPVKWQYAQITRRSVAISVPTGSILPARECPRQPITACHVKNLHGPVTHVGEGGACKAL